MQINERYRGDSDSKKLKGQAEKLASNPRLNSSGLNRGQRSEKDKYGIVEQNPLSEDNYYEENKENIDISNLQVKKNFQKKVFGLQAKSQGQRINQEVMESKDQARERRIFSQTLETNQFVDSDSTRLDNAQSSRRSDLSHQELDEYSRIFS